MGVAFLRAKLTRGIDLAREHISILALFSSTLFLSALLLFSVQPIFAKMVLPKLGGSPSVWAVSMCFFQAVLLTGYAYAHALNKYLPASRTPFVHVMLLAVALLALPFGLPAGAEPPAGDAYLWLIGILVVGVGLPFFAISANAPLLQAWFARSGHPHARDPYFLYGASNLGSLLALLGYPVLIEPFFGLHDQASHWTTNFAVLVVMVGACAFLLASVRSDTAAASEAMAPSSDEALSWPPRLYWIGLAFVPSGLLVAFTTHLSTDIASAPFLWVVPLAMFLGTFVLVFREHPLIPHHWMLFAQPVLVALCLLGLVLPGGQGWMLGALAGFGAFFTTTMVAHRELYNARPSSGHLTEFYMWMSLGGVLGGVFTAIIAPQIFNVVYEYPLLLLLGILCRPGLLQALRDRDEAEEAGIMAAIMVGAVLFLAIGNWIDAFPKAVTNLSVPILIVCALAVKTIKSAFPLRLASVAVATGLAVFILPSAINIGISERSFFGVLRVSDSRDGKFRRLMHGTTLHGAQRIRDDNGKPVKAPLPATYYHPQSPMAKGVDVARRAFGSSTGTFTVGSVGLGAGSISCYSRPAENWRFYEIDPIIVKAAKNPKLFSFLSRCRPGADMVIGDARLTLAREPNAKFNYLIIDAFSSDSVPVHLITREAIGMYLDKLAPNGVLALHISNRHMDLVAVAGSTALSIAGTYVAIADDAVKGTSLDRSASHVMFITKSAAPMQELKSWPTVKVVKERTMAPWTDDYSNIVSAIWRGYFKH